MGLFRRSQSKTHSTQEAASVQQRYIGAGRQAVEDTQQYSRQQKRYNQGYSEAYTDERTELHGYDRDSSVYNNDSGHYEFGGQPWQQNHHHQQQQQHHNQNDHYMSTTSRGTAAMVRSAFSPNDSGDFDDAASYHSTSSNPGVHRTTTAHNNDSYSQTMPSRYLHMATQSRAAARAERPAINSYYSTTGDDNAFRSPNDPQGMHGGQQFLQSPSAISYATSPGPEMNHGRSPTVQENRQKTPQELGEEYFQKAVSFHEQGDFVSATAYFKRAADKQNPLGMLFYGLSLRHGWGCQPNENLAFVFLQKAGEQVVPRVKDMDPAAAGIAREELAMAIYELGQSYRHGWGVSRNKKTAAYYFEVAADLGDGDAQADLASCYEKGDGVKRDMKKAAHYYRLAHKQGIELFGTSWIFKKKYESD
ncbi:hypothetical protein GGI25_003208 [Coemansia spiralis]|uniref:HCP-like protein n=2 Tax=Coemansia TaxID=4863 RepID=A0A9W8G2I9_9FUNG|nr:hypothetical protein EDC05_003203 [Coemansia umbellata]KAJ2621898.1 hypothetical protein GGI26_003741 [Coemansia sp. RSA 1358]KAJ2677453.1 hypothetical protein GGI25_003208 [Coemansia spiralis]